MAAELIRPTPELLAFVADTMRAEDVEECRALGFTPHEAMAYSVAKADICVVLLLDGVPAALCGVTPIQETTLGGITRANVFLLSTSQALRKPVAYFRAVRAEVRFLHEVCGVLVAAVDSRYRQAVDFFARLGFAVLPPVPMGPEGVGFHPIVLR